MIHALTTMSPAAVELMSFVQTYSGNVAHICRCPILTAVVGTGKYSPDARHKAIQASFAPQ